MKTVGHRDAGRGVRKTQLVFLFFARHTTTRSIKKGSFLSQRVKQTDPYSQPKTEHYESPGKSPINQKQPQQPKELKCTEHVLLPGPRLSV